MYKQVSVEGKGGIRATIILDSVSNVTGSRMVTYEIECHRFIWAEMLTHKMLSRNAASSRAIPNTKAIAQCSATPIIWQLNKSGMQSSVDLEGHALDGAKAYWEEARESAFKFSSILSSPPYSIHKQWASRLIEPFQMMKAVVSATEWDNFFWLRKHEAAQPEIHELARCMYEARKQSVPQVLNAGEWHLPYVFVDRLDKRDGDEQRFYTQEDYTLGDNITLQDALKVSAARCAAVSFRNSDYGLEKSREVWERLVGDERKHSSACEHQARVMQKSESIHGFSQDTNINLPEDFYTWEEGVSHVTRDGKLWSGNLCGFIQLRKLIDGECCHEYKEQ